MNRIILKKLLIILIIVVSMTTCKKPEPETVGIIQGAVKNTNNQPIEGSLVKINTSPEQTKTTISDGSFSFKDLQPKTYQISVTKEGYASNSQNVDVIVGMTKTLDFVLSQYNPTFTVTAPSAGTTWNISTSQNITWTSTGLSGNIKIELMKGTTVIKTIETSTENDGTYPWFIPTDLVTGSDYKIKITSLTNPTIFDESDYFALNLFLATLTITPLNQNVALSAGNTVFNVVSNSSWTANSDQLWCTISPLNGNSNGTISANYFENTSTSPRKATITISVNGLTNQTVTVTQAAIIPLFAITPSNQNVSLSAGNTTFTITSNVNWTASSDQIWCALGPSNGSGNGTLIANYLENTSTSQRKATISFSVAGLPNQTITITQAALVPSLFVTPSNQNVSSNAGNITFNVASNITWSASSDQTWCSLSNFSGNGNGSITANFTANNTLGNRVVTITISGNGVTNQTVTITQTNFIGTISISPTNQNVSSASGSTNFAITSNTTWSATSDQTWCTLTNSNASGNGTIIANYSANNSSVNRLANITITGNGISNQVITVSQANFVGTITITPTNQNVGTLAGNTTFAITSNTAWSATSDQTWCTLANSSGSGNGTITVNYSENTTIVARTAKITISGTGIQNQTVTVTQSNLVPALSVTPTNQNVTATAGNTAFSISSNIAWTASSDQTWCTFTTNSGTGNGTLTANFAANITSSQRIATITISGSGVTSQTVKVTQAGKTNPIYSGELVTVQGGTFAMGKLGMAEPIHNVTLSNYSIGKYEVTNQEYADFLNAYGQSTVKSGTYAGQNMITENSIAGIIKVGNFWTSAQNKGNYPVIFVTWYGANELCKYYGGRLPTEAEWEFAARGGINSKKYTYSGSNTVGDVAWYISNSTNSECNLSNGQGTHPVGKKNPNELGLYDMSGNVWEMCSDWWSDYTSTNQTNPTGPLSGYNRCLRGSAWMWYTGDCEVAWRGYLASASGGEYSVGFRIVLP